MKHSKPRHFLFLNLLLLALIAFLSGVMMGLAYAQDPPPAPADPESLLEALQAINAAPQTDIADFPEDSINVQDSPEPEIDFAPNEPLPATTDQPLLSVPAPIVTDTSSSAPEYATTVTEILQLPINTDLRMAIATDHSTAMLARDLVVLLDQIAANGHDQAFLNLLQSLRPEDNKLYVRMASLFTMLQDAAPATPPPDELPDPEPTQQLDSPDFPNVSARPEPAPVNQAPITPPSPPPPIAFSIVPITAQPETDWGQSEKAIISINRRRHVLWPGESITDPNGASITLLGVETEGSETNPIQRIVLEHEGQIRRLPWHWEEAGNVQ